MFVLKDKDGYLQWKNNKIIYTSKQQAKKFNTEKISKYIKKQLEDNSN